MLQNQLQLQRRGRGTGAATTPGGGDPGEGPSSLSVPAWPSGSDEDLVAAITTSSDAASSSAAAGGFDMEAATTPVQEQMLSFADIAALQVRLILRSLFASLNTTSADS
jgi:hypothetical protein